MREGTILSGRTVLAVLAHPDDEALACGGTLARATDAGARVVLLCASRGELGSVSDPALVAAGGTGGDLGTVRARELRASAEVLGVAEVIQLGHEDGCLRWADALDADITAAIEAERPDAVVTFDTDGLYWHGDHIGVHERTTRAVAGLGNAAPQLYYTSLEAGTMRAVVDAAHARGGAPNGDGLWGISPDAFGVAAPPPDFRVDVRPWIERKLAAMRCHRTQIGAGSPFAWIDDEVARRLLGFERFRRADTGRRSESLLEAMAEEEPT